jgi:hypothetical protein
MRFEMVLPLVGSPAGVEVDPMEPFEIDQQV